MPGRLPQKGIYVLSSGMMAENTPSYAAAACILHDPASTVCIVGYCDPETPGGRLIETGEGEPFAFDVLGYNTPLKAAVERFDLSGHADRDELLAYAIKSGAAKILLVHGEAPSREWFRQQLAAALPQTEVIVPEQALTYVV
jgi:Cft2 family RNA processing exonuclease